MFERLIYRRLTRNYFEPHVKKDVDKEDLMKILRGESRNPHRMDNPDSPIDYRYFIISGSELKELQSEEDMLFMPGMVDRLFSESEWFGKFSCESNSSIIVPNKLEIIFNPIEGLGIIEKNNRCPWSGGGFYQSDKDREKRILTSRISLREMFKLVKLAYNFKV